MPAFRHFYKETLALLPRIRVKRNPHFFFIPQCWGIEIARPLCKTILSACGVSLILIPSTKTLLAVNELKSCCEYWSKNFFDATKGQAKDNG